MQAGRLLFQLVPSFIVSVQCGAWQGWHADGHTRYAGRSRSLTTHSELQVTRICQSHGCRWIW